MIVCTMSAIFVYSRPKDISKWSVDLFFFCPGTAMCDRVSTVLLLPTKEKINKIYPNLQNFQPTVNTRERFAAKTSGSFWKSTKQSGLFCFEADAKASPCYHLNTDLQYEMETLPCKKRPRSSSLTRENTIVTYHKGLLLQYHNTHCDVWQLGLVVLMNTKPIKSLSKYKYAKWKRGRTNSNSTLHQAVLVAG